MKTISKNFLLLLILTTISVSVMAGSRGRDNESEIEPSLKVVENNGYEHCFPLKVRPSIILGTDSITILADDFEHFEIASVRNLSFVTVVSPYSNTTTGINEVTKNNGTTIQVTEDYLIINNNETDDICSVAGYDGQIWIKSKVLAGIENRISLRNLPSGCYIIKSGNKSIKYRKP